MFADYVVRFGITSIYLNSGSVGPARRVVGSAERKVMLESAREQA